MLSIPEILYIVQCDQEREVWSTIGFAVAALMAFAAIAWLVIRPAVINLIEKVRRIGLVHAAVILGLFVIPAIIYGSTKKTGVTNFKADECPDSVTFTWEEETSGLIVKSVQIERRLKGATEDEAWEPWGMPVSGGQEHITIDGFTLDRDYEYRARYIYTEAVQ